MLCFNPSKGKLVASTMNMNFNLSFVAFVNCCCFCRQFLWLLSMCHSSLLTEIRGLSSFALGRKCLSPRCPFGHLFLAPAVRLFHRRRQVVSFTRCSSVGKVRVPCFRICSLLFGLLAPYPAARSMWAKLFETVPTFGLFLPDNFIIVDILSSFSFSFEWNQKKKRGQKKPAYKENENSLAKCFVMIFPCHTAGLLRRFGPSFP